MEQTMEGTSYSTERSRLLSQALGKHAARAGIGKRPRPNERLIVVLLFAAGVLSIFTTAFIVLFLGTEAVSFFQSRAWIYAKMLVVDQAAAPVSLRGDAEGALNSTGTSLLLDLGDLSRVPFMPGALIQIGDEIMRVAERRERSVIVERGYLDTQPQPHPPGAPILTLKEDSVRTVEAIKEEDTRIVLPENAAGVFAVGDIIHLETETMRIAAIEGDTLVVERGLENTLRRAYPANAVVQVERRPTLLAYLTGTRWQPQTGDFGVLPLVQSTFMTSFIAILTALPVGLAAAIYLSEYATQRVRAFLNPLLEILVGVPTVVYGFFALQFVTIGVLRPLFGVDIYNTLSAGLVVGIMIVPTIASMSLDAMGSVPRGLREASYGLGATKLETIARVVLPAALSGIVAAVILGISRAVGETMIVAIAAGAGPNWTFPPNFTVGAETMTGHIARISGGDLSYQSVDYTSIFSIGLTLFIITFLLTQISTYITRRFRELYE